MSWGVALRNAVSIGLGGIATLFSGTASSNIPSTGVLLTELSDNLVQEDGGYILV